MFLGSFQMSIQSFGSLLPLETSKKKKKKFKKKKEEKKDTNVARSKIQKKTFFVCESTLNRFFYAYILDLRQMIHFFCFLDT